MDWPTKCNFWRKFARRYNGFCSDRPDRRRAERKKIDNPPGVLYDRNCTEQYGKRRTIAGRTAGRIGAEEGKESMDIWQKLYEKAKEQYHPEDVSPFVYAHHVVCALEAENGEIYTGFCIESCSGVMNLCAERVAALNMYAASGQTRVKRLIAFRDKAPHGDGSGMPCGACREFFYQLDEKNEDMEFLVDYETRETVTLKELMPRWWGRERYAQANCT